MRANTRKRLANPARLIALAAVLAAVMLLAGCMKATVAVPDEPDPEPASNDGGGLRIGYAADAVTAMDDQQRAQAMLDAMAAQQKADGVAFSYQNTAESTDGINFSCYMANNNDYDMFIAIHADSSYTDELFLSGLLRPGSAFESVTLNRKLDPGKHKVYVTNCLVDTNEETGEQTLIGEGTVTMDFVVKS